MLYQIRVPIYATQTTDTFTIHTERDYEGCPGCYKMFSAGHLHVVAEMVKVRKHSELLSAQYFG